MPFFEVSCKHNIKIEECFLTLARHIREQREHRVGIKKDISLYKLYDDSFE